MSDPQLRILLIDDDRVDRTAIVRQFKTHGLPYDVTQARSVAEALRHVRDGAFDVVLLDYMLGDGNGLELLQQLGRTPAIVLSGAGNEQIAVRAMREGACDYLIKDVAGHYLGVLPSIINNVVRRRTAEDALRADEERYRMIAENVSDIIWSADFVHAPLALGAGAAVDDPSPIRMRLTYASPSVTRILGYTVEEFCAKPLAAFMLPDSYRRSVAVLAEELQTDLRTAGASNRQWTLDMDLLAKDGSPRMCEITAVFLRDQSQRPVGVLGIARDITSRKRAEAAIRESEARYRAIFEVAGDGIIMMREDRFVECNPATLRIFGCTREEFIGHPPYEFSPPRQPDGRDSREKALEMIHAALQGTPQSFDWQHLRGDGTPFDAEVTLTRLDLSDHTFVQSIVRDATDRRRAERELRDYAAALEAANKRLEELHAAAEVATRSKSEFLANMSHEIRTPLTAIMGFAEIILSEGDIARAPPHRIEAINAILRNSTYLLRILNDILDLSKIEAGRLEVERVVCEPVQMVADVLRLMQVRADAKRLPLLAEFAGPIPETVRSDPTRLRQVLINLIGNAVKFTEQGSVRLVVRTLPDAGDGALLQFEIIDTGIGMEPHEVARLFQPFTQADNSTSRRFGGTGLGLTISKRLIEMLGGSIAVDSRPGAGSTFRATIATGPLEGVTMLAAPTLDSIRVADAIDDARTPAGQMQLSARVLLAEDAPDNQRLISFVLTKANAEVTCADNGQIACELALAAWREGRSFDLILMDMQMPVLDGYQATRALRNEGYAGKIIALTANAMAGQRELCLRAGCDDYVTKPINRQRLLSVLVRHLVKPATAAAGNDVY
jgi:PAS domain S-box-containing protein